MKKVFKKLVGLCVLVSLGTVLLTGCGEAKTDEGTTDATENQPTDTGENNAAGDDKTITIGATAAPHAEILEQVKPILEKEGYTLNIVTYTDYVQPNTALDQGDLDANYFQHRPYLENFNKEHGTDLVAVADIHFEPLGIYSDKVKSKEELKSLSNAQTAVPNDATNEARALLLLQDNGLLKLKDDAGINATALDVEEGDSKKVNIKELEAAQIVHALPDVEIACINGNYALEGGLTKEDALAVESADSVAAKTYANVVVVKAGNENEPKIQALVKALQSDEIRTFINDKYQGSVVPLF